MSDLFQSYSPYSDRIGRVYRVLITEQASDGKHLVGHNKAYEQVLLPNSSCLQGSMVRCQIVATGKHYMLAKTLARDFWVAWFREKLRLFEKFCCDKGVVYLSVAVAAIVFCYRLRIWNKVF